MAPFLEGNLKELVGGHLADAGPLTFYGKRSGHIPDSGELNPDLVAKALGSLLDLELEGVSPEYVQKAQQLTGSHTHMRAIGFCAGCPHRATFWSIKNALKLDGRGGFVTGDIGCYTMALGPTGYFQVKTVQAMGSGVGLACGFGNLARAGFDQPVVSVCGDSTFFHAAIPALLNGIYNHSNFTLLILDNSATAMTGFQPHPGIGRTATGEETPVVDIEALCRAMGVRVEVTDPFDLDGTTEKLLDLLRDEGGVRVLISKRTCALVRARQERAGVPGPHRPGEVSGRRLRLRPPLHAGLPVPRPDLGHRGGQGKDRRGDLQRLRGLCRHLSRRRHHQRGGLTMTEKDPLNVIVTGVGGQGNVLISQLIGKALVKEGYHVTIGETYGASQRGGAVMSHLRISRQEQYGPLIPEGQADVILGLEPVETMRVLAQFGHPGVIVIANSRPVYTMAVTTGAAEYPGTEEITRIAGRAVQCGLGDQCHRHRPGDGCLHPHQHHHGRGAGREPGAASGARGTRSRPARQHAERQARDESDGRPKGPGRSEGQAGGRELTPSNARVVRSPDSRRPRRVPWTT